MLKSLQRSFCVMDDLWLISEEKTSTELWLCMLWKHNIEETSLNMLFHWTIFILHQHQMSSNNIFHLPGAIGLQSWHLVDKKSMDAFLSIIEVNSHTSKKTSYYSSLAN